MKQGVLLTDKEYNILIELVSFDRYLTRKQPNGCYHPEVSTYKNIPIELLDIFRNKFGSAFRIRYRGERVGKNDGRTRTQCYQDCTKANARSFAAYQEYDMKIYVVLFENGWYGNIPFARNTPFAFSDIDKAEAFIKSQPENEQYLYSVNIVSIDEVK